MPSGSSNRLAARGIGREVRGGGDFTLVRKHQRQQRAELSARGEGRRTLAEPLRP